MSVETLNGLETEAQRHAAARSRAYRLFAEALDYPDEALVGAVSEGRLAGAIEETLSELDPALAEGLDREALREGGSGDDLAIEYTRLFDVGASGPPCPLYGGLWGGTRMQVMEETVRFYNHFGLTLSDEQRELPDHLRTELEFLHFLAYRQAEALQQDSDPGPFRRAERDFIERHPGKWVPKLRQRLEALEPMPFFVALVTALERLLEHTGCED